MASGIATRPIGTLTQKIACHARPSAIAPPMSGPIAMARPAIPPHAPRATARRSRGTAADRIVSRVGDRGQQRGFDIRQPRHGAGRVVLGATATTRPLAAVGSIRIAAIDRQRLIPHDRHHAVPYEQKSVPVAQGL